MRGFSKLLEDFIFFPSRALCRLHEALLRLIIQRKLFNHYSGSIKITQWDKIAILCSENRHIRIILLAFVFATSSRNHCAKKTRFNSEMWRHLRHIFYFSRSVGLGKGNWNNLWFCCCYCLCLLSSMFARYFSSQSHRKRIEARKRNIVEQNNRKEGISKPRSRKKTYLWSANDFKECLRQFFLLWFSLIYFSNFATELLGLELDTTELP